MVRRAHEMVSRLLQDRVTAALAVVECCEVPLTVVVKEDEMLALVTNNVLDAIEVLCVLGDQESTRLGGDHHSRGVDESALIEDRAGVLGRANRDVRRICSRA